MNIPKPSLKQLSHLLGLSVWFAWLVPCLFTPVLGQAPTYEEAYVVPVSEAIGYVVRGEAQYEVAAQITFRAGESGNEAYRDELRAIVERYTGDRQKMGLIAQAMFALWKLGEDDAYFREKALNWREDEWNARVAMNVLALAPTPENLAVAERAASESGELTGTLSIVQTTASQIERYEKLRIPQDKIDYALLYAVGTWRGSSIGYINPNIQNGLHPWRVNGIHWLRELSEEYPDLVARTLATYTTESDFANEQIESVRDHLAHFISDEAHATLQRLRADQ